MSRWSQQHSKIYSRISAICLERFPKKNTTWKNTSKNQHKINTSRNWKFLLGVEIPENFGGSFNGQRSKLPMPWKHVCFVVIHKPEYNFWFWDGRVSRFPFQNYGFCFLQKDLSSDIYIYIHTYHITILEPKWPLFCLELRPSFEELAFKNRGRWGSRMLLPQQSWLRSGYKPVYIIRVSTPPKFNSSPLKNDGWKWVSFWDCLFSGAMLNFRV